MSEEDFNDDENIEDEEGTFGDESGSGVELQFDSDEDNIIEDQVMASKQNQLEVILNTFSAYMQGFSVRTSSQYGSFILEIPRSFLPLWMSSVYGFEYSETLLTVEIHLLDFNWRRKPDDIIISCPGHPVSFTGRALCIQTISRFFSESYQPKDTYRSQPFIMVPDGSPSQHKIQKLVQQGYDLTRASIALVRCKTILEATDFLMTGTYHGKVDPLPLRYTNNPLLYLALELCDVFLNLTDHCCICGKELPMQGFKPSTCSDQACIFSFTSIGAGCTVVDEIRRDEKAADLIFSFYASALNTNFLTPPPPVHLQFSLNDAMHLVRQLPKMSNLALYQDDTQIVELISSKCLSVLRWVLLSNQAHFISVPKELELPEFKGCHQFLTLIASPQHEAAFQENKKKYKSIFVWHGSQGNRWHSILHNGLKDASANQSLTAHCQAYGAGVYISPTSEISWGYVGAVPNQYIQSQFDKSLSAIALCECAKSPGFSEATKNIYTQKDEKSIVVRMLLVGAKNRFNVNVVKNPPKIPTLEDVIRYQAQKSSQ